LDFVRLEVAMQAQQTLDCTQLLRKVRSVKTPYEIDLMKESARVQSLMFAEIPSFYRAGMTDSDLAIPIELSLRKKGFIQNMRVFGSSMEGGISCVWAGDNAAAPSPYDFSLGGAGNPFFPVGENGTVLQAGMSVMVDSGCTLNGYYSDQTRTFSVGKLSQKAYDVHQVSLEIHDVLSDLCKPGAVCEELYQTTLQVVEKYKLSSNFMGTIQQAPFVGHGVGLVINELPVLCDRNKTILETNMAIAIEPKFVLPGIGAVGIENTYIVRENGLEKITTAKEDIISLTF
jgi:Xaa-Pro dipeptidase